MRVSMEYFMKRRNLSWSSFAGMEYKRYEIWCQVRKIIPVSRDEFSSKIIVLTKNDEDKTNEIIDSHQEIFEDFVPEEQEVFELPSKTLLSKMNKTDLLKVCEQASLSVDPSKTKKQILTILDTLNN